MLLKTLLIVALLGSGVAREITRDTTTYDSLEAIPEPIQEMLDDEKPIERQVTNGSVTMLPIASYSATGVVVGTKEYTEGWDSEICPIDVALIWGVLVTPELRRYITYSQRDRWVYYEWKSGCPVGRQYIESHVGNTHCIPENDAVRKALFLIQKEDVITLEGVLVRVDGTVNNTNVWWYSSTTRSDTGDGACEVMVVRKVFINGTLYE